MSALSLFCFSSLCAVKKSFTTIICTSLDLTVFPKERILREWQCHGYSMLRAFIMDKRSSVLNYQGRVLSFNEGSCFSLCISHFPGSFWVFISLMCDRLHLNIKKKKVVVVVVHILKRPRHFRNAAWNSDKNQFIKNTPDWTERLVQPLYTGKTHPKQVAILRLLSRGVHTKVHRKSHFLYGHMGCYQPKGLVTSQVFVKLCSSLMEESRDGQIFIIIPRHGGFLSPREYQKGRKNV